MMIFLLIMVLQTTKPLDTLWADNVCVNNVLGGAALTLAWDEVPSPQPLTQPNGKKTSWTLVEYELYITVHSPNLPMRIYSPKTVVAGYPYTMPVEGGNLCFSVMGKGTYLYLP